MFFRLLCLSLVAVCGLLASAQPRPPQAQPQLQVQLRVPRWMELLRAVRMMPAEPYAGITSLPAGYRIDSCSGRGAIPSNFCYDSTRTRGPNVSATDEERLQILRYLTLKYNVSADPAYFTAARLRSSANMINGYAGHVRHKMYQDLANLQSLMAGAPTVPLRGNHALLGNHQRQIKLLDYLFPDAAIWHLLLLETGKIK